MRRLLSVFLSLCLCSIGLAQDSPGQKLVSEFIAALNSRDKAVLTAFVNEHCGPGIPVEARLQRLSDVADRGAPFKIVKFLQDRGDSARAILEDKNRMQLGLQITMSPDHKMRAAMIGDPSDLDATPPKDYTGWKDVQSLTDSIRRDTENPAFAIAVIHDGKLEQAVDGTRLAGGSDKVGIDEPFSIGSIGKSLCSTVIGKLVDEGKLKWDTTLGEALSDLPMKDGYKPVTLEQIMHHRGGIPAMGDVTLAHVKKVVNGETDPTKIRINNAKDILQQDMPAKPGERFIYSNAGYALLSTIAERVTGKPYEQLVKEIIFEPLHLEHSYTAADKLPDARPSGHLRGPDGWKPENMSGPIEYLFAGAGGGMFMSVGDLARYAKAHLDGFNGKDGILRASTFRHLQEGLPEEPGGRLYACGWGIEKFPGLDIMHTHNGSNGTMRAQVAFFPESDLVVAALCNAGGEAQPSPPLQAILAVAKRYAPAK